MKLSKTPHDTGAFLGDNKLAQRPFYQPTKFSIMNKPGRGWGRLCNVLQRPWQRQQLEAGKWTHCLIGVTWLADSCPCGHSRVQAFRHLCPRSPSDTTLFFLRQRGDERSLVWHSPTSAPLVYSTFCRWSVWFDMYREQSTAILNSSYPVLCWAEKDPKTELDQITQTQKRTISPSQVQQSFFPPLLVCRICFTHCYCLFSTPPSIQHLPRAFSMQLGPWRFALSEQPGLQLPNSTAAGCLQRASRSQPRDKPRQHCRKYSQTEACIWVT